MRQRLPVERAIESTRQSGKVRLVNVSEVDYEIPPVPDANWFGRVMLRSGCTLTVPEGVPCACYLAHRYYPPDSWQEAIRQRLIRARDERVRCREGCACGRVWREDSHRRQAGLTMINRTDPTGELQALEQEVSELTARVERLEKGS